MIESIRPAWKALPLPKAARRAISPALWSGIDRLFELRLRRRRRQVMPGPAKVAGFFSESHGIAASAHRCANALEALGVETERVDLGSPTHAALLLRQPPRQYGPGGAWIFHVNPPELVVALAMVGAQALAESFLAGYWAWELPRAPALWLRRKALVDEVWAPSTYTAGALAAGADTIVRVVPHPISSLPALDRLALRAQLGLPPDKFIVATLFDFRSSFARKNPLGAISTFRHAFGDDPSALLIVKAQHGECAPQLRAQLHAENMANICLIDESWSLPRAQALIGASDVVLSLHRAEGFGLTPAEAMAAGTPVIATNWSGNIDFMRGYEALVDARLTPVEDAQRIYAGQTWAEPDVAQAAALLRRLRADEGFRQKLVSHGRSLVEGRLSLDAYRRALGPAFWTAVTR